MLSLPVGKHPVLGVAVAIITNSRETKAGTSGSCGACGGSGNPEREMLAQKSLHTAAAVSQQLCVQY